MEGVEAAASGKRKNAKERVPCPADPKHTVPVDKLEAHLKVCNAVRFAAQVKAAPHFEEDVNAGSEGDEVLAAPLHVPGNTTVRGMGVVKGASAGGLAAARADAARTLGKDGFLAFAGRVQAAFQQVCGGELPPLAELLPECLGAAVAQHHGSVQAIRHARQSASICGHLMRAGILPLAPPPAGASASTGHAPQRSAPRPPQPGHGESAAQQVEQPGRAAAAPHADGGTAGAQGQAQGSNAGVSGGAGSEGAAGKGVLVELGAGKGFLTAMAASVPSTMSGLTDVCLVDCRVNMKFKADRHMSHLRVHRLALDLKDLELSRMAVLQQGASDATPPKWHEAQQQQEQQQQQQQQEEEEGGRQGEAEGGVPPVSWCLMGKHLCGAATDFSLRAAARCCRQQQQRRAAAAGPGAAAGSPAFKGLAISTCCHHRCDWQSYVGKRWFRQLGFTPREFELVAWMSGWALCGHDGGSVWEAEGAASEQQYQQQGVAPKQPDEQQLKEEETGNGVAGSGGAPAAAQSGVKRPRSSTDVAASAAPRDEERVAGAQQHPDPAEGGPAGQQPPAPPAPGGGAGQGASGVDGSAPGPGKLGELRHGLTDGKVLPEGVAWDPVKGVPRPSKVELGAMAKLLVDRGRVAWLAEQLGLPAPPDRQWLANGGGDESGEGARVELVRFVGSGVSGENKLLVARLAA